MFRSRLVLWMSSLEENICGAREGVLTLEKGVLASEIGVFSRLVEVSKFRTASSTLTLAKTTPAYSSLIRA